MTRRLSPVLADIIRQGNDEGTFNASSPELVVEFITAVFISYEYEDFIDEGKLRRKNNAAFKFIINGLGYKGPIPNSNL